MAHDNIQSQPLRRRLLGILLSATMAASTFVGLGTVGSPIVSTPVAAASSNPAATYGLMDSVQDGVILHAWDWSFNNIKANMAEIAEAGYTAVQTSVIQQCKQSTLNDTNEHWWLYYQPSEFKIGYKGDSALGTKEEFQTMCEEAHKYGIHVIVDIVSNHLGNQTGNDKSTAIPAEIRNNSAYWHTNWNVNMNGDIREQSINYSLSGLPDLNTENADIQQYVIDYMKECIDAGADGFRFDTAKHIGIEADGSQYTFWKNVIPAAKEYYAANGFFTDSGLYCYGELLGGTGSKTITQNYFKYIALTDDSTGNEIRNSIVGHNAAGAANSNYHSEKNNPAQSVLWAESHDTYSNDDKQTTNVSTSDINKTWAMVGSRNKATALYFARTDGYRGGNIGDICSTECFSDEVVAVNKFHNAFVGQSEYLLSSGDIAYNMRGSTGIVLVNVNGGSADVNVSVMEYKSTTKQVMADGTYTDQISGNTFTVANGTISGTIGSTGIAVVYNADTAFVKASADSDAFTTDTMEVTLLAQNMTDTTYHTSEGDSGSFENGDVITIGEKSAFDTTITLTLTGVDKNGETVTKEYEYRKVTPVMLYFDNTSYGWESVYVYIYSDSSGTLVKNADWPGEQMTYNQDSDLYEYVVAPTLFDGKVIFVEKKGSDNRYPGSNEEGMDIGGVSRIFSAGNSFEVYEPAEDVSLTVTSSDEDNTILIGEKITLTGTLTGAEAGKEYTAKLYYYAPNAVVGDVIASPDTVIDLSVDSGTITAETPCALSFSANTADTYTLYYEVYDGDEPVAWQELTVTVREPEVTLKASADKETMYTSDTVTVTGTITGEALPSGESYKARLLVKRPNGQELYEGEEVDIAIDETKSISFCPSYYNEVGTYTLTYEVLYADTDGNEHIVANPSFSLIVEEFPVELIATADKEAVCVGDTVTVTGTLIGNDSSKEYTAVMKAFKAEDITNAVDTATGTIVDLCELTFIPTEAGEYSLLFEIVDDNDALVAERWVALTVAEPLAVEMSDRFIVKYTGQSGSISGTVTGGFEPYTYEFYFNDERVTPGEYPSTYNVYEYCWTEAVEGTFIYKVIDAKGNTVSSDIPVSIYAYPTLNVVADNDTPLHGDTVIFTATLSGELMPATYEAYLVRPSDYESICEQLGQWWPSSTDLAMAEFGYDANNNKQATLTYTANFYDEDTDTYSDTQELYVVAWNRDNSHVVATQPLTLTKGTALTVEANTSAITVVRGEYDGVSAEISGGVTPYTYEWLFITDTSSQSLESGACEEGTTYIDYAFEESGILRIQVTDSKQHTASEDIPVTVLEPLKLEVSCDPDVTAGEQVEITAILTGDMPDAPYTAYLVSAEAYENGWSSPNDDFEEGKEFTDRTAVLNHTVSVPLDMESGNSESVYVVVCDRNYTPVAESRVWLTIHPKVTLNRPYALVDEKVTITAEGNAYSASQLTVYLDGNEEPVDSIVEEYMTSMDYTPDTAGQYTLVYEWGSVDEQDGSFYSSGSTSFTLTVAEKIKLTAINGEAPAKKYEFKKDAAATMTVTAEGGFGGYTYTLLEKNADKQWETLYSTTDNTLVIGTSELGMTSYCVRITDSKKKAGYAYFTVCVYNDLSFVNTVEKKYDLSIGDQFTFDAAVTGGSGEYEYRLWVRDTSAEEPKWSEVISYTEDSNIYFTLMEKKRFNVRIQARDTLTGKSVIQYCDVRPKMLSFVNTFNKKYNISLGETFSVDALAQDGYGGYQYRLDVKVNGEWQKGTFSDDSTLTFTPEAGGRYNLRIWVQDARPNAPYTLRGYMDVMVKSLEFQNTLKKRSYGLIEERFVYDAEVTGGSGNYTYAMEEKDEQGNWQTIYLMGDNSKMTFVPRTPGIHYLRITAADTNGEKLYFYPDVVAANTDKRAGTFAGDTVAFNADVYLNNDTCTYSLDYRQENGTGWTSAVKNSDSSVLTWEVPQEAGEYRLRIVINYVQNGKNLCIRLYPDRTVVEPENG